MGPLQYFNQKDLVERGRSTDITRTKTVRNERSRTDIDPGRPALHHTQDARPTRRTEAVTHILRPKPVFHQRPLALRNNEVLGAENPSVAPFEADAAVAFTDRSELRELNGELEAAAVAVAFVGLELRSWCGGRWRVLRHGRSWFDTADELASLVTISTRSHSLVAGITVVECLSDDWGNPSK